MGNFPKLLTRAKRQRGFAMISVMVAILLTGMLYLWGSGKWSTAVYESAAESTGRYLSQVRGATLTALTKHLEAFTLVDTSTAPTGTYPAAPAWATFTGASTTISVADLKGSKFLPDSFPDTPPLGRSVHVTILRTGTCPGADCAVTAYAFTCWPISKGKPAGAVNNTSCPTAPGNWQSDPSLVGAVIIATDGYGGTNSLVPGTMRGPLFNIPSASLGIPGASSGNVAVLASLTDNLFPQFVRQGDTRHIYLKDSLSVTKQITTDEGLTINTAVAPGSLCPTPGSYATSNANTFVQCVGGQWFELTGYTLMAAQTLANGAAVIDPICPGANRAPFSFATLQNADVTMTGADISVSGTLAGGITGTGNVSASGSVSVSGTFNGTTQSTPSSSIRVAQGVSIVAGHVVITPATTNARALVMQGCRSL
ncbi:type II secretion system protein [Pseudomonas veronii]|uniref:type II secretion system protein n=1 Tax=Pseudomonas veronii TaxID=76761 RepID=UPI0015A44273|nr:type II secretion system protein [Pseudomonas veronii]NWD56718.1 type II secretion system protein [Pseudomonas veronii]